MLISHPVACWNWNFTTRITAYVVCEFALHNAQCAHFSNRLRQLIKNGNFPCSSISSIWHHRTAHEMPPTKDFERKCEICKRSNFNGRMLGPLIHTNSISAHYNCVLYSPITPDAESVAPRPEDEAIAGVSTRFIREEGRRAQKLVIWIKNKKCCIRLYVDSHNRSRSFYRRAISVRQVVLMSAAVLTSALMQCLNFAPRSTMLIVDWMLEFHSP